MSVKAGFVSNQVDAVGDMLSDAVLDRFVKDAPGLAITLEFDHERPVGIIRSAERKPDSVEVEMLLKPELEEKLYRTAQANLPSNTYCVSAFAVLEKHQEGEIRVIDKAILLESSLTSQPVDSNIRPVFEVKREDD